MHKTISIRKNKEASLLRKHPWVFSGAVQEELTAYTDGEIVKVVDGWGRFLAMGHFQHGSICVRVLSFEEEAIHQAFYEKRLAAAFALRQKLNLLREDNSIFRLIHAEGDGLPGLIVDYYGGVAVLQAHSIGMHLQEEIIAKALQKVLGDQLMAVYAKSKETLPGREGAENRYLIGNVATPHVCIENGQRYAIDWISGQKTGFFIDQRENRALLKQFAKDKSVLNTFCYSGGFSVTAFQGGASFVRSIDSSGKAIALTDENLALNGYMENREEWVTDAVKYLEELNESFEIIVLDPPAFAKKKDKRHNAVKAYKRINASAIRQIKSGGILFTFSCSQVVDKYLFNNTILAAAIEAGRNVRILHQLHQPADHPINIFHPEGEYLKGLVVEIQ